MTDAQQRARRAACENMPPSLPGSRHAWWYAYCEKCGKETEHLSVLGGACVTCCKNEERQAG